MTTPAESYVGSTLAGRYVVEELIGHSPPMDVYRATDADSKRAVVVKLLPLGAVARPDWIAQFRAEARIVRQLRHPHTVRMRDFGELEPGVPFIVLDYVEGVTLQHRLEARGALRPEKTARLALQIARSLEEAHRLGVCHLAIHPANIVLARRRGKEIAHVVDYMAARSAHGARLGLGAPAFASPEQFRGQTPVPATDIYALGLVMWTCLVGRPPIASSDWQTCRRAHLSQEPFGFPEQDVTPHRLRAIVARMIARDLAQRYDGCGELIDDLQDWLTGTSSTLKLPAISRRTRFFPVPGEIVARDYEIVETIGSGGFSRVYRARHLEQKKDFAIKILRPDRADMVKRFSREGEVLVSVLKSQHTVTAYDYGETAHGMFYIVFEFIEGENLEDVLGREGALGFDRVVDIVVQVLDSLEDAHAQGVLHRDIKPTNIMLERRDDGDWITVLDFGVAKFGRGEHENLTKAEQTLGTPRYMAPEQLAGEESGPESDIYSLGLVAFELLTGQKAIAGTSTYEIATRQLDGQSVLLPDALEIPAPLRVVFNKMLRKERTRRYHSAAEVRADLAWDQKPAPDTLRLEAIDGKKPGADRSSGRRGEEDAE